MRKFIFGALALGLTISLAAQERPEMVAPGRISEDAQNEFRLVETHRGNQWVYSTTRTKGVLYSLYLTSKTENGWSTPKRFTPSPAFAKANILEAFFTRSGHSVLFVSNLHNSAKKDYDIWHAYIKQGWVSKPKKLPALVNSKAGEWFPSYQDGVLTFCSERPGGLGGIDIYQVNLDRAGARNIRHLPAPINSPYEDFDPVLARDGSYMIFSSNRPSQYKGTRLYLTFRNKDGGWGNVVNLGKELGEYIDGSSASLSANEETLFFTARAKMPRRSGDLYSVDFQPILARLREEAAAQ